MRFSGHETFTIREGWLHKGLELLLNKPEQFHDQFAADYLGVGSNMAKSIRHWLNATELAEPGAERGQMQISEFGRLIFERDPYFVETDTWWLLHINLVNKPIYADTWYWFFNSFNLERFDRSVVTENLRQFVSLHLKNLPSLKTLHRDVGCLLSSYSQPIPNENHDVEESRECPFRNLELMTYHRTSGYYRVNYKFKQISPGVFGYCVSRAIEDAGDNDIDFRRLMSEPGGPGCAFKLTNESLVEIVDLVSSQSEEVKIRSYAGLRALSVPRRDPLEWVKYIYSVQSEYA